MATIRLVGAGGLRPAVAAGAAPFEITIDMQRRILESTVSIAVVMTIAACGNGCTGMVTRGLCGRCAVALITFASGCFATGQRILRVPGQCWRKGITAVGIRSIVTVGRTVRPGVS